MRSASFSPDGLLIATASYDGSAGIWHLGFFGWGTLERDFLGVSRVIGIPPKSFISIRSSLINPLLGTPFHGNHDMFKNVDELGDVTIKHGADLDTKHVP